MEMRGKRPATIEVAKAEYEANAHVVSSTMEYNLLSTRSFGTSGLSGQRAFQRISDPRRASVVLVTGHDLSSGYMHAHKI